MTSTDKILMFANSPDPTNIKLAYQMFLGQHPDKCFFDAVFEAPEMETNFYELSAFHHVFFDAGHFCINCRSYISTNSGTQNISTVIRIETDTTILHRVKTMQYFNIEHERELNELKQLIKNETLKWLKT